MYRILVLVGFVMALLVSCAGIILRLFGAQTLFEVIQPEALHFFAAYGLAPITLLIFLMSWWQKPIRITAVSVSFVILVLLGLQVASGVAILKMPEQSLLYPGHLILSMFLTWVLFWLYLRSEAGLERRPSVDVPVWFASGMMVVLFMQIVLGNWVSVHQAGLVCTNFPPCIDSWWPEADYLGMIDNFSANFGVTSYPVQVAYNWMHRIGAFVCFILLNFLMLKSTTSSCPKPVRKAAIWLSFLLFTQIAVGLAGHKFQLPPGLVIAHAVFAILLMLPLIAIRFYGRYGFAEAGQVVAPEQHKLDTSTPATVAPTEIKPSKTATVVIDEYVEPPAESLFLRLKSQLSKTRSGLGGLLNFQLGQKANDDLIEEIEATLLMADVGIDVTTKIVNRLTGSLDRHQLTDTTALTEAVKQELLSILEPCSIPLTIPKQENPFVILVVGVNGVGKTTTIGKLAKRLKAQGHSVMLAAGDTFRAAAVEQLQTWGERNGIHVVAQHTGADSASVIYDGIQSAQSKGVDVLIADTAGRLHTKSNLMEELKKVVRIMTKLDPTAPHEVLLVLDAGTGQNALSQAKLFNEAVGLTGLALTKLDGTAKGGVIFALAKQTGIPIRFIGVGEGIDDLQDFNADNFVAALFGSE